MNLGGGGGGYWKFLELKIGVRLKNYAAMVVCLDSFSNHAYSSQ